MKTNSVPRDCNNYSASNKGRVYVDQLASQPASQREFSFCSLLFDNKALTGKSGTITCCLEAIHAVNAALWHPGEQAQKSQRQTDRRTNQTTTLPQRASGNNDRQIKGYIRGL